MRLVEKKCPNCGASLEFSETDKSCVCTYCKRAFEIERDSAQQDFQEQFSLKPSKSVSGLVLMFFFIMFLVVAVLIASVSYSMFSDSSHNSNSSSVSDILEEKSQLVSSVEDLSNSDIQVINSSSKMLIKDGEGRNDAYHSYDLAGSAKREKLYVAYKEGKNYIISIYKAVYHDFFHQENEYTVYVPIVFENVEKDVVFSLGDGDVSAPEYYFNEDKSSYTYGYSSFDEAYTNIIKPLESEYTITEK